MVQKSTVVVQKEGDGKVQMSKAMALFRMGRIEFTLEAILRVSVGALLFHVDHQGIYSFKRKRWLMGVGVTQLTNIAVNYYNMYADFEADLIQHNSKQSGNKMPPILVTGILPRSSALVMALICYAAVGGIITGDRFFCPETTPFIGQTLYANLFFILLATQYNGYFNTSHTAFCELNSLIDLYLGAFLCGYNLQRPSGHETFVLPIKTLPLIILDHILGYTRLLVMNLVDIEADMTVNKVTMAGVLGKQLTAEVYFYGQLVFAATAAYLAYVAEDTFMRQLIISAAVIVLPQTLSVAAELRAFAQGKEEKRAGPPVKVSVLELQVLALWAAQSIYHIR